MCELAVQDNIHVMVDGWEASQPGFIRTAQVLDHFDHEVNINGGIICHCQQQNERHITDACMTCKNEHATNCGCSKKESKCSHCVDGMVRVQIHLLAGGDLIQSFAIPNLWAERDVNFKII